MISPVLLTLVWLRGCRYFFSARIHHCSIWSRKRVFSPTPFAMCTGFLLFFYVCLANCALIGPTSSHDPFLKCRVKVSFFTFRDLFSESPMPRFAKALFPPPPPSQRTNASSPPWDQEGQGLLSLSPQRFFLFARSGPHPFSSPSEFWWDENPVVHSARASWTTLPLAP